MRDIFLAFNQILIMATDFHTSLQYQILRKSVKWEPRCYIRTDMTKLISSFRNNKNAPENHKPVKTYSDFDSHLKSLAVKLWTVIRPIVTYASETWLLKETIIQKLFVFERKILRRIFGPMKETQLWRIKTNEELDKLIKQKYSQSY